MPAIVIPNIWKGIFKPAKPYGERKPLTNIIKHPKNAPSKTPKINPTVNVKKDVNSTFGGLGVNCIARHKAVKMPNKANFRVLNK